MKFVFFHGSFVGPEYIWWPYLKQELKKLNQEIIAPQYPVDFWKEVQLVSNFNCLKNQTLENWTNKYIQVKKDFKSSDKLCFVCHSLGPLFSLHMLDKFPLKIDCAIFIAPFFSRLNKSKLIDHVNTSFYRTEFKFKKLQELIPESYVLYSNDDPYVDNNLSIEFAQKLHSRIVPIQNLSHMDSTIQLKKFPLLLELCKTRIPGSTYLSELQSINKSTK